MTRQTDDQTGSTQLPEELVRQLNDLGFVLLENETPYTFARSAIGSEVRLLLEPVRNDMWRVGVKWRQPEEVGRIPTPLVSMSLNRLGESVDGETIHLKTGDLVADLPRLMARSVLPLVDLAPS
jgi:hypothetical protein